MSSDGKDGRPKLILDEADAQDGSQLDNMSLTPTQSESSGMITPANTPVFPSLLPQNELEAASVRQRLSDGLGFMMSKFSEHESKASTQDLDGDEEKQEEGDAEDEDDEDDDDEDDDDYDPICALPKRLRKRYYAIQGLENKYEEFKKEYTRKLLELQNEYEALYAPLFERRSALIRGEVDPEASDLEHCSSSVALLDAYPEESGEEDEEEEEEEEEDPAQTGPGIPTFWFDVISGCEELSEVIQEHDIPVLKYLRDLRVKTKKESRDFVIEFEFAKNPFFSDTVLTKSYSFDPEEEELIVSEIDGYDIHWLPGKNVTKAPAARSRGKKRAAPQDRPSFFKFFVAPSGEGEKEEEEDDDEEEGDDNEVEQDIEMALFIKNSLFPHALREFLGASDGGIDIAQLAQMLSLSSEEMGDSGMKLMQQLSAAPARGGRASAGRSKLEDDDDSDEERAPRGKKGPSSNQSSGFKFEAPKKEECKTQ